MLIGLPIIARLSRIEDLLHCATNNQYRLIQNWTATMSAIKVLCAVSQFIPTENALSRCQPFLKTITFRLRGLVVVKCPPHSMVPYRKCLLIHSENIRRIVQLTRWNIMIVRGLPIQTFGRFWIWEVPFNVGVFKIILLPDSFARIWTRTPLNTPVMKEFE